MHAHDKQFFKSNPKTCLIKKIKLNSLLKLLKGRRAWLHWGTHYDRSHPLCEDEWGEDFLEKLEQEAICSDFLSFWQRHAAADIKSIPLLDTNNKAFDKCTLPLLT